MANLWLLSDDGDIVRYQYQVEEERQKGEVAYSRSYKGVKFLDSVADSIPKMYRSGIRNVLFDMAKSNNFKKRYVAAMF